MGRTVVVVSIGIVAVLAGLLTVTGLPDRAAAQDGPVVVPSRQITTNLTPVRAHTQPEVVVHPDDPNTLVIIEGNYFPGTCHTHVSRDGGVTWTTREARPQPDGDLASCTRPAFGAFLDTEFGVDGTLYFAGAASERVDSNGSTTPYVARSEDLGQSWEIVTIADGTETREFTDHEGVTREDTQRYTNTRLAVHPTDPDIVYVGYRYQPANLGFDEGPRRTRIAVSQDGGRSWSDLVDPFNNVPVEEVYGSDQPALTVARDGTVHAFTKERPAPDAEGFPRLLATTSQDGGQTWEGRVLDDSVAICGPCLTTPEAATDPDSGNVYVVFELSESPPPDARANRDIWAVVSTDGGESFGDRVRLNDGLDPDRDPDNNQMFPGIDIAPNGRVDVAWYDFRSDRAYNPDSLGTADHKGDLYWDVYYTYSEDDGRTWAPNVRISDRSMHRQDGYAMNAQYHLGGPISVAATDAQAHMTWSDSRNGRPPDQPAEDAYYTAAVHQESGDRTGLAMGSVALGAASGLLVAGIIVIASSLVIRRRSASDGTA